MVIIKGFTSRIAGPLAMLAVLFGGTAYAADQKHQDGNDQDLQAAYDHLSDYAYEKKQEFIAWLDQREEQLDRKMVEIEAAAEKGADEAEKKWRETSRALNEQRRAAAEKAQALREVGAEAWQDAKKDVLEAWQTLEKAMADAADKLSDGDRTKSSEGS